MSPLVRPAAADGRPSMPGAGRPRFHDLVVADVVPLTETSVAIDLDVPPELAADYAFTPGQYLTLRRRFEGVEVRRSYSICVSPARARETGRLRIAAALVRGGVMSTWLNEGLRTGDTVSVMTPFGDFVRGAGPRPSTRSAPPPASSASSASSGGLEVGRHHVAIAAGSGITPVLAILSAALEGDPAARFTLLDGNRRPDTIMFRAELTALERRHGDRLTVVHVLSRLEGESPPAEGRWLAGRLDAELLPRLLDEHAADGDEWYVCGGSWLVETARAVLTDRNVDPSHVHHETFHTEVAPPSQPPAQSLGEPPPEPRPDAPAPTRS